MTVVLTAPVGATGSPVTTSVIGDKLSVIANLTFSGNYTTGGDTTLLPLLESLLKQQGRGTVEFVSVSGPITHYPIYDYAAGKLQFIVASTGVELAEIAYPAGITGRTARLYMIGR